MGTHLCVFACVHTCVCVAIWLPLCHWFCLILLFIYLFMHSFIYHFILCLCPGCADLISSSEPPRDTCLCHCRKLQPCVAILPSGGEALCLCVVVNGPWPRLAICNVTTPGIHVFTCIRTITIVVISSRQRRALLLILSPSTWDCSHSLRLALHPEKRIYSMGSQF